MISGDDSVFFTRQPDLVFKKLDEHFQGPTEFEGPFKFGYQIEGVEVSDLGFKFCSRYFVCDENHPTFVHRDPLKMSITGVTNSKLSDKEIWDNAMSVNDSMHREFMGQ